MHSFDDYLKQNEFIGLTATSRELGEIYEQIKTANLPSEIKKSLQEQLLIRQAKAIGIMNNFKNQFFISLDTEIKVFSKISSINEKYLDAPFDLEDFLVALESLDSIDEFLGSICNRIIKYWIPEVTKSITVSIKKTGSSTTFIAAPFVGNESRLETNARIIGNLSELAKFVSTTIFRQTQPPDLFLNDWSLAISKALENILCENNTNITPEIVKIVSAFEVSLMDIDMLSPDYFPLVYIH
jgi:hypothetical protein